jgi:hypothetical protein
VRKIPGTPAEAEPLPAELTEDSENVENLIPSTKLDQVAKIDDPSLVVTKSGEYWSTPEVTRVWTENDEPEFTEVAA